jgi:riboflavin biosynthesis pyrimidine reductase
VVFREGFTRFGERKTREAVAARLPPYKTEFDRHDQTATAIGNDWTTDLFDGPFFLSSSAEAALPDCSLVFVQTKDGNTGAKNPAALGGGETDKHLIYEGLSRVAADAVLAGAETIRRADLILSVWHPELVRLRASLGKPRHPVQIVATLAGLELDNALLFNVPEISVVILTVAARAGAMKHALSARPWINAISMKNPDDLRRAFEELRAQGIGRISCIGGRSLAGQLIDAGLVNDLYLTTAARSGGEPNTPLYAGQLTGAVVLKKHGTGEEEGVVFEHIRMRN